MNANRFKDKMTVKEIARWLSYVKGRSMIFQMVDELKSETAELMESLKVVESYDMKNVNPNQTVLSKGEYWTALVTLDFNYVTAEQKYDRLRLSEASK